MLVPVLNRSVILLPAEMTNGLHDAPVACITGADFLLFLPSYICQANNTQNSCNMLFNVVINYSCLRIKMKILYKLKHFPLKYYKRMRVGVFFRTQYKIGLHRISASALAKPKFGHFSQIRPNSASAKFLAEFGRRQCNCSAFS